MTDMSSVLLYAARFFGIILVLFVVVPWLGAWFMHRGFERAKIAGPPLSDCVRACFLASSATIVVVFGIHILLKATKSSLQGSMLIFLACYLGPQLLFVPLFLRHFSQRALVIQEGAILLANAIVLGLSALLFF